MAAVKDSLKAEAAFEPFDPAFCVYNPLLSGEKRVAYGADLHSKLRFGRARGEDVSAGASDLGLRVVLRMYGRLHYCSSSKGIDAGDFAAQLAALEFDFAIDQ